MRVIKKCDDLLCGGLLILTKRGQAFEVLRTALGDDARIRDRIPIATPTSDQALKFLNKLYAQRREAAKRDFQQSRVYSWERLRIEPLDRVVLDKDGLRSLVHRACSRTGIHRPEIKFINANVSCRASPNKWRIEIASWGRMGRITLLHEIAHLADPVCRMRRGPGHGPRFVRTAMDLYEDFAGIPGETLEATAKEVGLAFTKKGEGALATLSQESAFPEF